MKKPFVIPEKKTTREKYEQALEDLAKAADKISIMRHALLDFTLSFDKESAEKAGILTTWSNAKEALENAYSDKPDAFRGYTKEEQENLKKSVTNEV